MTEATLIKLIDTRLNNNGTIIVEEARGRLDLPLACALVEVESGGENVFGHDYPELTADTPPYYGHPVTKERVAALRASSYQNGVGLTQLTHDAFLGQADALGGAHLPRYQCRVGFQFLCDMILDLGYALGIGAYNAGPANAQLGVDNGYYDKIASAHEAWKTRLGEASSKVEWPTKLFKVDGRDWATDEEAQFLRAPQMPNRQFKTNANGWLYAMNVPAPKPPKPNPVKPPPPRPKKGGKRHPGSGPYVEAHPTNFNWRDDVRRLVDKYEEEFYGQIFINTYWNHPPIKSNWDNRYDPVSFDVWHSDGRGAALPTELGRRVFNHIFNDPSPPLIRWCIYRGWMWTSAGGWEEWNPPDDGSDPGHWVHAHFTFW